MQVKGKKKILAYILVIVMITTGITGCMSSDKTVATINGERISEPVYRICLWITQKYFESVTTNIWEADTIDGKTPEEYAKDRALSSLKLSVAAKQKADELGIKLTRTEKKTIKDAAKAYMAENESFAKAFNIKQKHFEEFLTYNTLIDEVIQKLGENYMPNEDELTKAMNEVRSEQEEAVIEHILISNRDEQGNLLPKDKNIAEKNLAEEILSKAIAGDEAEFKELITIYSEDEAKEDNKGIYTIKKGQVDANLEEIAFKLGEIGAVYPKVIETEYGYEIVKVISRNILSDEEINALALESVRAQFASTELTEIGETLKVEKLDAYNQITIMK